jgi:hypothetical protein
MLLPHRSEQHRGFRRSHKSKSSAVPLWERRKARCSCHIEAKASRLPPLPQEQRLQDIVDIQRLMTNNWGSLDFERVLLLCPFRPRERMREGHRA